MPFLAFFVHEKSIKYFLQTEFCTILNVQGCKMKEFKSPISRGSLH